MLMREKFPRLLFLGDDRDRYISALRAGNDDDYQTMVSSMADLILSQRMDILIRNKEKLIEPLMKTGPIRLTDY